MPYEPEKQPIFPPDEPSRLSVAPPSSGRIVRLLQFFSSTAGRMVIGVAIVAILGVTYYLTSLGGPLFRGAFPTSQQLTEPLVPPLFPETGEVCDPAGEATETGDLNDCKEVLLTLSNCAKIADILKRPTVYRINQTENGSIKTTKTILQEYLETFCPLSPAGLKYDANNLTAHSVRLTWNPSSAAKYVLYRAEEPIQSLFFDIASGKEQINSFVTLPGSHEVYTDTSVLPSKTYYYVLTIKNKYDAESGPSNQVKVIIPKEISASGVSDSFATSPATTSTTPSFSAPTTIPKTTFSDTVGIPDITQPISGGTTTSPQPVGLPNPPTDLKAEAQMLQIVLSWKPPKTVVSPVLPSEPITGYKIYRGTSNAISAAQMIKTLSGNLLIYTDNSPGLQPGTTYFYFVRSVNKNGQSSSYAGPVASSLLPKTPQDQPPVTISTPQNFKIDSATFTKVTLSWSAVAGIDGYRISRDMFPIGGDAKIESKLFTIPSGATSYEDSDGIQLGRKFAYQITAYKGGEESEKSQVKAVEIVANCPNEKEYLPEGQLTCKSLPTITAFTLASDCTLYKSLELDPSKYGITTQTLAYVKQELAAKCAPTGPGTTGGTGGTIPPDGGTIGAPTPKAPTSLTLKSNGHIFLNWSDSKESGVTYIIYKSEGQGIPPTPPYAKQMSIQKSEFLDQNVLPGVVYSYSVVAVVGGVFSLPSNPVSGSILTPLDTTPPQPPQDIAVKFEPDGLLVSWKKNPEKDIAGYYVYRSQATNVSQNEKSRVSPLLSTAITAFKDLNVNPGETYFYAVAALDKSNNESKLSAVAQGAFLAAMGTISGGATPQTFAPGTGQMFPAAPAQTIAAAPTFAAVYAPQNGAPEEVTGTGPETWVLIPMLLLALTFGAVSFRKR